jgi:DNA-binding transcriptional MerR regulator
MVRQPREMRIDELAREAGTTVRNVRAYQERGLLPPPRRQGRVGLYSDAHLARLRLIGTLLQRGYSTANIGELLDAWQRGQEVGELLGLEVALGQPWGDELPTMISSGELVELFGLHLTRAVAAEAQRLDLLSPEGDGFLVQSPGLLRAGAELVRAGIPLDVALAEAAELRMAMEKVAAGFVDLVATFVFDPLGELPPADSVPRLAETVQRLRPLVKQVVDAELARAMERQVRAALSDRIGRALGSQGPADRAGSS